jgi:hypothetical protein
VLFSFQFLSGGGGRRQVRGASIFLNSMVGTANVLHMVKKLSPKKAVRVLLSSGVAVFFLLSAESSKAWCMWGMVKGERLGYIGDGSRGYAVATTARGKTTLNTQTDKKAIFFGYVGNEITIKRDGRLVAHCGNYRLEPKASGGYTKNNAIDGSVTYQPGWLLMQSPIVTRIYDCQPHGKGYFRMAGGQGAMWSTGTRPIVNEVWPYQSSEVEWTATGHSVFNNLNFVSLIDMDDLWPCEMIEDFATPGGMMALKTAPGPAAANGAVVVRWDTQWPCNYSAGGAPISEDNILFTISGGAYPREGGRIRGLGQYHGGRTVTLTAEPAEGYEFSYWDGGYSGNPARMNILVEDNIRVTAVFREKPPQNENAPARTRK